MSLKLTHTMYDATRRALLTGFVACLAMGLTACGGGGGGGDQGGGDQAIGAGPGEAPAPTSLDQAAYRRGTTEYEFGLNSIPNIPIVDAPEDTDFSRWAMLHDGSTYRLYFFVKDSDTTMYQFGFDGRAYTFGHDSIPQLEITGAPSEANPGSFAMLHDGRDYRLYMRGRSNPTQLFQFAFNPTTGNYEYGFRSIPVIDTTGLPADADLGRWAMLFDGSTYRQYVGVAGRTDAMYQCGYNGRTYAFGFDSIPTLDIVGTPATSDTSSFAMLHDGADYRFYHLAD